MTFRLFAFKTTSAITTFIFSSAMTQAARDAMLDDHNELRANVFADTGYYATNMLVMVME